MQSPPTLPRRRGRLQPDPKCCGPGSDGLTAESNANMGGRSFARPGGEALRRGGTLPVAVRQLLFLDCEDRALLHLDVAHDANAADLVAELYIVASRFDACDPQALVVVNRSVPIILALVGTPIVFSRRRHLERRDRVQGEIPESNALAVLRRHGRAHESECDRSKQHSAHPRLPQLLHRLSGASEKDLTRARDGRYSAPCRNSWRHRVRSAQSASSR